MTFDQIPPGTRVFLDANIFIYHSLGTSDECRYLLDRCSGDDIDGVTGAHNVLEAIHRLMMMEAIQTGIVSPGNVPRKLKNNPSAAALLNQLSRRAERLLQLGIELLPIDYSVIRTSGFWRRTTGFLTNDSVTVSLMQHHNIKTIATNDRDFQRLDGLDVHWPRDV